MWRSKLNNFPPVLSLTNLPNYAFQFFFANMGEFKAAFFLLTLCGVLSAVLRFYAVYLLGDLISHAAELTKARVLGFYVPLFIAATVAKEAVDFFLRKFAEAYPVIYMEHLSLRFYRTLLQVNAYRLFNVSKERLQILLDKYIGHISHFLNEWFWGTSRRITQLIILLAVLYWQSPVVLFFNLLYMVVFLAISFQVSRRFSRIVRGWSEQALEMRSVTQRFLMQLNTVRRLREENFFLDTYRKLLSGNWSEFEKVRLFHARRWFLQLNLFNALYIGTLTYGVLQVIAGELALGFLVLIKYAFDNMWDILVYMIEYYVALVTQREDAAIVRKEFRDIFGDQLVFRRQEALAAWQSLEVRDGVVDFPAQDGGEAAKIKVPKFTLKKGAHIGIIGESGVGKTTVLNMLMNLVPFSGQYAAGARDLKGFEFPGSEAAVITSYDPLFNISLRENILLGRSMSDEDLKDILQGLCISGFAKNLALKFGDPALNFSTGQEQRLRLARGVCQGATLYLLDEPFNGIDLETKAKIMACLKEFFRGRTVILVTHDHDELELVDEVYEMRDGLLQPAGNTG